MPPSELSMEASSALSKAAVRFKPLLPSTRSPPQHRQLDATAEDGQVAGEVRDNTPLIGRSQSAAAGSGGSGGGWSSLIRQSLAVVVLLSTGISALLFASAFSSSTVLPPDSFPASASSCPSPLPDLEPIDADADYWPTMRTTLRLCPANAHSTVVLAAGSRWLTDPVEGMRRHAWSVAKPAGDKVSAESNILASALMQGVGYGEPAWEPDEWQVDWNERKRQQRAALEQSKQSKQSEPSNRRHRTAPPIWPPTAAHSSASTAAAFLSPSSSSAFAAFNASVVPALLSSSSPSQAAVLLTALSQTVASFDSDSPSVRAYLDRAASYSFHSDFNWDWARWKATKAPWYEIQLSDQPASSAHRLLFWESEWVLGEDGLNTTEVRTTSVGDGLSTMVVVYEGRQHEPLKGEEFVRAPMDVAKAALQGTLSCRYEAEVDLEVVRKRQVAGEKVDVQQLDEVLKGLTDFTADAILVPVYVEFLWQDSHYRLHCPAYAAAFNDKYVLDQHRLGPMLRVTALHFSFKQESHAALYGFQSISLPLCYTRLRHVQSSVTLGGVLHGPPVLITPQQLHDWLNHYLFLGFQHVNVPDRFGSLLPSLYPYIQQGLVSWTRIPFLVPMHMPYMDQHLVVNYFLAHHRHVADWALVLDVDELLTFSHPYFSHNPNVVQPPHDSCSARSAAWEAWRAGTADRARTTSSGAQLCRSIVSSYLSMVSATSPLLRDMSLQSVPMWGLPPGAAQQLLLHANRTEALRHHFDAVLPPLSDRIPFGEHLYRRWNVSLLTFAAQQLNHSHLPYQHVSDTFPYRNKGADQRPKPFFQPLYACNAHQHGTFYARKATVSEQERVVQLSQARDMWGFFPDAGSAAGVMHALNGLRAEQPMHPELDLHRLLCDDASTAARWNFTGTGCCDSSRANATLACFLASPSTSTSARSSTFTAFDLAILTPLFPVLSQTVDRYQRAVYPQHVPNAPLAIYAPHVSHYFCANAAMQRWLVCSTVGYSSHINTHPGLAMDSKQDREREAAEDESLLLLRQRRREWMRGREWNYHRDHLLYWERWRAEEQQAGHTYSTC